MGLGRDVSIAWLGRTGVKVTSPSGKTLLIDPGPGDSGEDVDAVLVTHAAVVPHACDLGIAHPELVVIAVEATAAWLEAQGVRGAGALNLGGSRDVLGVRVLMTRAEHSNGALPGGAFGGAACGYVITFGNGFRVYHSGLTGLFGDLRLLGELYEPDLALLALGPEVEGLGPFEAAHAVRLLGVRRVVPMTWADARSTLALRSFRGHLDELRLEKVQVIELAPGQVLT